VLAGIGGVAAAAAKQDVSAAAVAQMTEEMEARLSAIWRAEALALRSELAAKAPANELATLELQQVPLSLSVCCFRR
jgi:hypothetical protein